MYFYYHDVRTEALTRTRHSLPFFIDLTCWMTHGTITAAWGMLFLFTVSMFIVKLFVYVMFHLVSLGASNGVSFIRHCHVVEARFHIYMCGYWSGGQLGKLQNYVLFILSKVPSQDFLTWTYLLILFILFVRISNTNNSHSRIAHYLYSMPAPSPH